MAGCSKGRVCSCRLQSRLCTQAQLESPQFIDWAKRMLPAWSPNGSQRPVNLHRKLWEWVFIARALEEGGVLRPGCRGLGFGVGQEPQAALFASLGCEIVATDLDPNDGAAARWADSGQHAARLDALNATNLCPPREFSERVQLRRVDMNRIPTDLTGFDFTWSSCAFEHLGSIVRGQDFVLRQMECLRPGGLAVHTTEFNLSSDRRTLDWRRTVLFRRRDIEELAAMLKGEGHSIELDFEAGNGPADLHVDAPPYSDVHLKVWVRGFKVTSLGLVIRRSVDAPGIQTIRPGSVGRHVRSVARLAESARRLLIERLKRAPSLGL